MLSTPRLPTSNDQNVLSNSTLSTSINSLTTKTDLILSEALRGPLAAPVGWHSEVIDSNSSIPTDTGFDLISTNNNIDNNYDEYNTTTTFNTSQTNQSSSKFLSDNIEYINSSINKNSIHQQPFRLTQQQQKNIVNLVENQSPPPLIVRKTLPNNLVTYQQNISVKYLQPPTPPPPGPIIIREVRPPPPPQSPIRIRERPPPPSTPPPLVLRERPPPIPPRTSAEVVEKLLPPLPKPPRRVIIERYEPCPPKPSDVVIERWLPYKQVGPRPVLLERAPAPYISQQEPNLLILHNSPQARINKEFINQGVVRTDPESYLQRYGAELNSSHSNSQHGHLIGEATRVIPPPPLVPSSDHDDHTPYLDRYQRASSPYIPNTWETTRVASPILRSSSHDYSYPHYDTPDHYCNQSSYKYRYDPPYHYDNQFSRYEYDSPHHYCNQSSSRYGYDSYRSYDDDYPIRHRSYRTMTDITPSWNNYCRSSSYGSYHRSPSYDPYYRSPSYDPYYRSSSYYPTNTIRVRSENEFCHVLCDLTNGRIRSTLDSY